MVLGRSIGNWNAVGSNTDDTSPKAYGYPKVAHSLKMTGAEKGKGHPMHRALDLALCQ